MHIMYMIMMIMWSRVHDREIMWSPTLFVVEIRVYV